MTSTTRPSWDDYGMALAHAASIRGDCIRRKVGAVLMDNQTHYILSTGFNGSEPGGPSCLAGECARCLSDLPSGEGYDLCIERHAEWNLIDSYKRKHGWHDYLDLSGTTVYVTYKPCSYMCEPLLRESFVSRVVWEEQGERFYLDLTPPKM